MNIVFSPDIVNYIFTYSLGLIVMQQMLIVEKLASKK